MSQGCGIGVILLGKPQLAVHNSQSVRDIQFERTTEDTERITEETALGENGGPLKPLTRPDTTDGFLSSDDSMRTGRT